jgi:hypothetical protein
MTDLDASCHATVVDFPVLTDRYDRAVAEPRRVWHAVQTGGQWTIVGDCFGRSAVMALNPYRRGIADDAEMARDIADTLDSATRVRGGLRMLLAAVQMHAEAAAQGIDASADLREYARIARGLISHG